MSSDPGDPRKLKLANEFARIETNTKAKKAREALLKSQPKSSKSLGGGEVAKVSQQTVNPKAAKSGSRILGVIKANPKTSAAIAGTTALIGSGVMAYNHYKNKNK